MGNTITYTVTLTDNGPNSASNVNISDLLPAGLNLVSASTTVGSYNTATGVWTVGTIAPGTPQTLRIAALVAGPNATTNTATITHADQFDPDTANNTSSIVVTTQQAELSLTKSVSNKTPNVGDTITYTITLGNSGPSGATGVQVQDALPSGLAFVSAAPSQGNYDSASGLWSVGKVNVGSPVTLAIQATVTSPDPQTNTATIAHADQFDPVTSNDTATVVATPQQADLALTKTVNDTAPNVGATITYTVTLTNNGPDAATGAQVTDLLPSGVSFVSAAPGQGTYDPATGLWDAGTVNAGSPVTLAIQAMVTSPDPQTNTATISHADQFDPNPGNNNAAASQTPQQADLVLTKQVDNASPNVGGSITFTVGVQDLGPSDATNVVISDPLPAGLTLVSDVPSQGTYDRGLGRVVRRLRLGRRAPEPPDHGHGPEPERRDEYRGDHPFRPVRSRPR